MRRAFATAAPVAAAAGRNVGTLETRENLERIIQHHLNEETPLPSPLPEDGQRE